MTKQSHDVQILCLYRTHYKLQKLGERCKCEIGYDYYVVINLQLMEQALAENIHTGLKEDPCRGHLLQGKEIPKG